LCGSGLCFNNTTSYKRRSSLQNVAVASSTRRRTERGGRQYDEHTFLYKWNVETFLFFNNAVLLVESYLLVVFTVCCGGKSKESKSVPSSKLSSLESIEGHEKKNTETEKDGEEQEEAKSTSMVEQV
jgi:hypothetical protein